MNIETVEQLEQRVRENISKYRPKWTKIGLGTGPTDKKAATSIVNTLYRGLGYQAPQMVWVKSPLGSLSEYSRILTSRSGSDGMSLMGLLRSLSTNIVYLADRYAEWGISRVGVQIRAGVWDDLWAHTRPPFTETPKYSFDYNWAYPWTIVDNFHYGPNHAELFAVYDLMKTEFKMEFPELDEVVLSHLSELAKLCGWILFFPSVCIVSDRPEEIHIENDRLHNPNGQALRYSDGLCVHAWRGIKVPENVIMRPESITKYDFVNEPNAEVRRAMIEATEGEILNMLDLEVLDQSDDPELGVLYEFEFTDVVRLKILRVANSSLDSSGDRKVYWLIPDQGVQSVEEAHASISGLPMATITGLSWA